MELIKKGAEADLYLVHLEGKKVLVKERIRKSYRIEEIDRRIRKQRTQKEVKIMNSARKLGIKVPQIIKVEDFKIFMEWIDGNTLKDVLNFLEKDEIEKIGYQVGRILAKLHSNKIFHGDPTTSNLIIKEGEIYLIDFGLSGFSQRIEDYGVDLNLMYESLKSSHSSILNIFFEKFKEGYKDEFKDAEKVFKRMDEIEKRARYK